MATGKLRHGSNFLITSISLLVILVVINAFSYRHFVRWDLTRNKDYSISKTTRDLIGNLDDIINITVYLSKDLPAALLTFERQLRDTLAEYEAYGKGKLRIRYEVPGEDPQSRQELMLKGIRPQPVGVFTGDTQTRTMVYNSISIQHQDKEEIIGNLLDRVGRGVGLTTDFEYLLTSKISKVKHSGNPVVGWLTNAPDIKIEEKYGTLQEVVRQEWDIRPVRLDPPRRIPQDIAVLVIISPRNWTKEQLFEIDQYLMRGGKILALVDTYEIGQGNQPFKKRPTNFARLLEHYGLKVNDEMVLEQRYRASAPLRGGFLAPYPYWIHIVSRYMNQDNRCVAGLTRLTFPWAQTLDRATTVPAGVTYTPLAWSSPYSLVRWGQQISPNPMAPNADQSTKPTTHTVIAMLSGKFPSYFPKGTPYPLDGKTTAPQPGRTPETQRLYESADTQVVVVANSLFVQDDFVNRFWRVPFNTNNDVAFVQNTLESLAYGTSLGQIRARELSTHPIKSEIMAEGQDGRRNAYKVFGTFTMPILVIIGGVLYNMIRRRRRAVIAARLLQGES